jgi:hypothetical protein
MRSLIRYPNSLPVLMNIYLSGRRLLQTISALPHVNDGADIGNEFLEFYNAHVADLLHHDVRYRSSSEGT